MPIIATRAYKASNGVVYASIEEAQKAELERLFEKESDGAPTYVSWEIAEKLLKEAETVLAILTTGPRARPKARKSPGTSNPKQAVKRAKRDAGGTKAKHDADVPASPEAAQEGFKAMHDAAA